MELRKIISAALKDYLNENLNNDTKRINEQKTYDKIISLEKWYKDEEAKLKSEPDFKIWKIKHDRLFKLYLKKKEELTKEKDAYALKGDLNTNFIYHYTTAHALFNILTDNEMIGGGDEYGGVSFTSHPNLYKRGFIFWHPSEYSEGRHHGNAGIKIKFDFNMMKNDGFKFKPGNETMGTNSGEEELRLLKDEIVNPIKYIKEVIIFADKEKNYHMLIELLQNNNIKYHLIK